MGIVELYCDLEKVKNQESDLVETRNPITRDSNSSKIYTYHDREWKMEGEVTIDPSTIQSTHRQPIIHWINDLLAKLPHYYF